MFIRHRKLSRWDRPVRIGRLPSGSIDVVEKFDQLGQWRGRSIKGGGTGGCCRCRPVCHEGRSKGGAKRQIDRLLDPYALAGSLQNDLAGTRALDHGRCNWLIAIKSQVRLGRS